MLNKPKKKWHVFIFLPLFAASAKAASYNYQQDPTLINTSTGVKSVSVVFASSQPVYGNLTTSGTSISTVAVKGSGGQVIDAVVIQSTTALSVLNLGRTNLAGLSFVYKSTDNFVVGASISLTGKANEVDLQAIGDTCTFNINGGESIIVVANTGEFYNFDYTATNLIVNLTAKAGSATCKARITGAN